MDKKLILKKIVEKQDLHIEESEFIFNQIFQGKLDEIEIASFLTALKVKGESPEEIAGAIKILDKKKVKIERGREFAIDTCGTGGDGKKCINVSTAVAITLSTAGIKVVKHGNSAQSGFLGSADILKEFNIPFNFDTDAAINFFKNNSFVFLFAPLYHPAMKYVVPIRKKLGFPTIFNFIGPFINPAEPDFQVTGISNMKNLENIVNALSKAGKQNIIIYSSEDGYDEISTKAPTRCFEINSEIKDFIIYPEDYFEPFEMPEVKDREDAKYMFIEAISGRSDELAKLISINAMLPFCRARGVDFKEGYNFCYDLIKSGKVLEKFKKLQNRKGN